MYPKPGDKDDMHCHNADQTFYVIDGECTMHFPDGGKAVMKPGMAATITGGSFYQLENTGPDAMVLMGNRSGPSEAIQHINYELRKDIKSLGTRRDRHASAIKAVRAFRLNAIDHFRDSLLVVRRLPRTCSNVGQT